jgi:hypothetical protein
MSLRLVPLVKAASLVFACCALAGATLAVAQEAPSVHSLPAPNSDDSVPPITVQIAPPPISISSSMIGVAGPLGAQATAGKPISAEFVTEHHQNFTDGNRISRSTTSIIFRDALGRIRRESQLSVPGLPSGVAAATFITIVDHRLGCGWVLDPQEMVAHHYALNGAGPSYVARLSAQGSGSGLLSPDSNSKAAPGADSAASPAAPANAADSSRWRPHNFAPSRVRSAQNSAGDPDAMSSASSQLGSGFQPEDTGFASAPAMRIDQPFLAAPNPVRTENLGEEIILGFRSHGTRVITTLPPGEIGNDRPIDIVSEQWFSPDLQLVMRSLHRDPWAGEFTTTVVKISRGEQPASLFEVPAQYKVIDADTEGEHHVLDSRGSHASAGW